MCWDDLVNRSQAQSKYVPQTKYAVPLQVCLSPGGGYGQIREALYPGTCNDTKKPRNQETMTRE